MKNLITTMIAATICYATANADVLTLLPVADSTVDALQPDTVFATGNLEAAMTGDSGGPATELTFLYAQYQLPDGMTGEDIARAPVRLGGDRRRDGPRFRLCQGRPGSLLRLSA